MRARGQLKSVFKPDQFAPQEPRRSQRKPHLIRYGTASAIRYSDDDDRYYHNQWYFNYEAPDHTGQYDDTAKHDSFAPDEPWNNRQDRITLDGTFADLKQACEKAGRGHVWDAARHECLYKGSYPLPELPRGRGVTQEGPSRQAIDGGPIAGEACEGDDVDEFGACRPQPEGEVDQYGWRPGDDSSNGYKNPYDPLPDDTQRRGKRERDTTLDYQTADLEKACRQQMKKPVIGTFYSWDAWHARCLYYGKPAHYKRQAPKTSHPLTDGKYWDERQDCLRRGSAYSYRYPWRDGEPGQCLNMGHVAKQGEQSPMYGPLDYLKMDLRNMCKARGWIWRKGRCGPKALTATSSADDAKKFEQMEGTVSQDGWKAPQRPLPPPQKAHAQGFPLHQNVDPALIHDYLAECARMDGVIKYVGHKVLCISHDGCTVADQNGAKFDCEAAGLKNLYGSIDVSKSPGLPVDKFNPGGSVAARWRTDKSAPAWLANSDHALSFENVDLHGKDLDPYTSSVTNPISSGRAAAGGRAGQGERGGEGPLQLGDDSSRPLPLNGEKARPWRSIPLSGKHAAAATEADTGEVDEQDCPGEVDQYGWYPPSKPCASRKTGMVQKMPGGGVEGGWTSGYNGDAKYYYNHYTNRIAWKGPAKLPYECTEEENGAGIVPDCDWSEDVDLATGERYWKNNITGKRTWQTPFADPEVHPKLKPTTRKGTWSGAPGGNKYWTPAFARAQLGASTKVFDPAALGRGNCGGATGMCLGDGVSVEMALISCARNFA